MTIIDDERTIRTKAVTPLRTLVRLQATFGALARGFSETANVVRMPVYTNSITVTVGAENEDGSGTQYPYVVLYDPAGDNIVGAVNAPGTIMIGKDASGDPWDLTTLTLFAAVSQDAWNAFRTALANGGSPDTGNAGNGNGHT